jgi:hypothetical protein
MIYYWVDSLGSFNWRILVVMSKSTGDWYNLERDALEDSQEKFVAEVLG